MKPRATLGLSHGFLLGAMRNDGVDFRPDINVVLMAPKVSFLATESLSRRVSAGKQATLGFVHSRLLGSMRNAGL
jgi:hypothetical protein